MKKILINLLLCIPFLIGCTTNDVDFIPDEPGTDDYYEILDAAFAEYMIYNSTLPPSNDNALPANVCFKEDGKYWIDKKKAATAIKMYLVKDATRIKALQEAGVPYADVKIANINGIQFFTSLEEIRLTSNVITGALDFTMLTQLAILEMNSNYVNSLKVPAAMVRLRYSASNAATAPDNRWLESIDLTACSKLNHVFLTNHHIGTGNFLIPTVYTDLREIDVSGNPGAPFPIPAALFNQLTTKSGVKAQ